MEGTELLKESSIPKYHDHYASGFRSIVHEVTV
jgi:hypothetical protein